MWSLITVLSSNQELQVAEGRYRAAHSKEQGKLTEVCSNHCTCVTKYYECVFQVKNVWVKSISLCWQPLPNPLSFYLS